MVKGNEKVYENTNFPKSPFSDFTVRKFICMLI